MQTKREFEARYQADYRYVIHWGETHVAMECTCEDGGGPTHWACVRNTPEAIAEHEELESIYRYLREVD